MMNSITVAFSVESSLILKDPEVSVFPPLTHSIFAQPWFLLPLRSSVSQEAFSSLRTEVVVLTPNASLLGSRPGSSEPRDAAQSSGVTRWKEGQVQTDPRALPLCGGPNADSTSSHSSCFDFPVYTRGHGSTTCLTRSLLTYVRRHPHN